MKTKYRIVYDKGRYYPQQRKLFIWFFLKANIDGYHVTRNFSTYKEAMGFIYVYHQRQKHNKNYIIVE